jgi:hypothetical protein
VRIRRWPDLPGALPTSHPDPKCISRTCPVTLLLSSTVTATSSVISLHGKSRSAMNAPCSPSDSISPLEIASSPDVATTKHDEGSPHCAAYVAGAPGYE